MIQYIRNISSLYMVWRSSFLFIKPVCKTYIRKKQEVFYERFDFKFSFKSCFWCHCNLCSKQFVERCFGRELASGVKSIEFIDSGNPWNQWVLAYFCNFCVFHFVKNHEVLCALFSVNHSNLCRKKSV